MTISSSIILFIIGFALLLKGADILTDSASALAKKLGISNFVIGVIVVGIGTSIPELIVTILSNLSGSPNIGLGTVIGSNTFNILAILGASAIISPLALTKNQVFHHLALNIIAVALTGFLIILNVNFFGLTRVAGLLLLSVFIFWIYYLNKKQNIPDTAELQLKINGMKPSFVNILLSLAGLFAIIIGGSWVTESSVAIARFFNIKDAIIGLTIVAIGTSLPELVASTVAAYKKNCGIAVGNIIGSNIFDFLMILGLSSAMRPMRFTPNLFLDLSVTLIAAILLFILVLLGKKYIISRLKGSVLLSIYIIYLLYLVSIR